MTERPSLMEQAGISGSAPAAQPKSTRDNARLIRAVGAGALLVVAAGVLAWTTGLIGGGKGPKVDPKVVEQRRERFDQELKQEKAREAQSGVPPVESGG